MCDIDIVEVDKPDHSGNRFAFTVTDRKSSLRWSMLMKGHKGHIEAALRAFQHWLVSEGIRKGGQRMHFHGDGEFVKGEFRRVAIEMGFKVTASPPHCQWGNGKAERTFRTLIDGTRAVLACSLGKVECGRR